MGRSNVLRAASLPALAAVLVGCASLEPTRADSAPVAVAKGAVYYPLVAAACVAEIIFAQDEADNEAAVERAQVDRDLERVLGPDPPSQHRP